MSDDRKQAPIQTLRDGAIVVKLWQQDGKNGPYASATLGRTYKNEQTGEYGESHSLSGSDVLKAQALLGEANKEMILWREYYKEIERQQQPDRTETPSQTAARDAATADPAQQQQGQPAQGLAAQRDGALANAKPPSRKDGPDHGPER